MRNGFGTGLRAENGGEVMKKRDSGAALIIVMCVMFVVVALSLALLRSAAVLIQTPVRDNQREQCRINAVSVSEAVSEEIESFCYDEAVEEETAANPEKSLKDQLAMAAAGEWEDGERLQYQLQTERIPGETRLEFYVVKEENAETVLYMEVSSMVGKESCTVVNRFVPVYHESDSDPVSEETGEEENEDTGENEEVETMIWSWKFLGRSWGEEES